MRKERSDKKTRVNPPLDQESHEMLVRLALACGISKTHMAEVVLVHALRIPDLINTLQNDYRAKSEHRILTVRRDGKVFYHTGGEERSTGGSDITVLLRQQRGTLNSMSNIFKK